MTDTYTECARKWWMISAAAGVAVAFIAGAVLGVPWFGSVLLGIIVGGIMGYVTVRSQCTEADVETARPATPSSAPSPGAASTGGAAKPDATDSAPTPPDGPSGAPAGAGAAATPGQSGAQGAASGGQTQTQAGGAAAAPAATDTSSPASPPAEPAPAGAFLDAPRGGKADDLKRIKGVGPKLEQRLNSLGLYHYDQIAALTEAQIAHIDEELDLRGRIMRDDWVGQAAALAGGSN